MRRAFLLFVVLLLLVRPSLGQTSPIASDAEPSATHLPEKLTSPRDEAAEDRVAAAALFAHGRMLQQRRDSLRALRRYQRAYRYDPQPAVLKEIVSLALDAGRTEEAARYAALSSGAGVGDLIVLRRLAPDATKRSDWKLAAQLYEASFQREEIAGEKSAATVLLHAETGRLQFLSENYDRAWQHFAVVREALAKPDDYGLTDALQKLVLGERRETLSLMARCALEAKQYDDALTLFRDAYREEPTSPQALLDEARVAERRGDAALAQTRLEEALQTGKLSDNAAIELLRRVILKTEPAEKVEAAMEERLLPLHQAHPENEVLRRELARCRINQGKLAEAEPLLSDASLSKPSEESRRLLAAIYRRQNQPEKWLVTVASVAADSGLNAIQEEKQAAAENEAFAKLLLALPDAKPEKLSEQMAQRIIALVALERKEVDQASRHWELALPGEGTARGESLLMWGLRLLQADQYEASMKVFQRILDEKLYSQDNPVLHFYLSGSAALAEQHELALAAARKAAQLRPNDVRFAAREGWVLYHLKRYDAARRKYEALLARFDKATETQVRSQLRETRLLLSSIQMKLGNAAAAIECLEQVLDEFPEDVGAMNDLAYLWAEESGSAGSGKHLRRSLAMVQKAVTAEPENTSYRDTLGWVLFRLQRYPEAIGELERACADDTPSGIVLDHLGDALSQVGRLSEAKASWQKAVEAYRQDGNADAAAVIEKKIGEISP
jgi:tetratricopeptide (TPR) repeat protein